MPRARDSQRSKVYKAETLTFRAKKVQTDYRTVKDCKSFVQEVVNSKYWQSQRGKKRVKIKDGRGRRAACFRFPNIICLPLWARNKVVIIHELAHMLTHQTHPNSPAHGRFFCMHYVHLVEELIGISEAVALVLKWNELNVNYEWSSLEQNPVVAATYEIVKEMSQQNSDSKC